MTNVPHQGSKITLIQQMRIRRLLRFLIQNRSAGIEDSSFRPRWLNAHLPGRRGPFFTKHDFTVMKQLGYVSIADRVRTNTEGWYFITDSGRAASCAYLK